MAHLPMTLSLFTLILIACNAGQGTDQILTSAGFDVEPLGYNDNNETENIHLGKGNLNIVSVHDGALGQVDEDAPDFEDSPDVDSFERPPPVLAKAIIDVWKMPPEGLNAHVQLPIGGLPVVDSLSNAPPSNFSLLHFIKQNMSHLQKLGDTIAGFLRHAMRKVSHSSDKPHKIEPTHGPSHNFTRKHGKATGAQGHRMRPPTRKLRPIPRAKVPIPDMKVEDYRVAVWLGFGLGVLFVVGVVIIKRLVPRRLTSAVKRLPYDRVNDLPVSTEYLPINVLFSPLRHQTPDPDLTALLNDHGKYAKM